MSIPTLHTLNPAYKVIERLGGKSTVASALQLNVSTLSRWCQPWPNGTGGAIPQRHWPKILQLAEKKQVRMRLVDLAQPRS